VSGVPPKPLVGSAASMHDVPGFVSPCAPVQRGRTCSRPGTRGPCWVAVMTTADPVGPRYAVLPDPHAQEVADSLTLVALDNAGRLSEEFVRHAAIAWGFPTVADRAGRVAARLITRAVKATGIPGPRRLMGNPPPFLGIRVSLLTHALVVDVWDSDPTPPGPVADSVLDPHLTVVNDLCLRWNWYMPDTGGKVIWAEIGIPGVPQQRRCNPLPRRTAGTFSYPEPDEPVELMHDPHLLQDVLDGLRNLPTGRERRGER
jgi:hypothetical protein